eukprot:6917547-Pyramimonas_sp.AAC.1
MDQVVGHAIEPHRGIVAGSSTATLEVKGYMIPTIHETRVNNGTSISVHIDDITFDSIGDTIEMCLNGLADSAGRVFAKFTYTLELPIHMKKNQFHVQQFRGHETDPNRLR